jgi:hypothetical protein
MKQSSDCLEMPIEESVGGNLGMVEMWVETFYHSVSYISAYMYVFANFTILWVEFILCKLQY